MADFFSDFAENASDLVAGVRSNAEDLRRGLTYGEQQITSGIKAGSVTPLDSGLNFAQRTWLYASDTEKVFIVLGIAGLAFAVYSYYKG